MSRERPNEQLRLHCGCFITRGGRARPGYPTQWGDWRMAEPCDEHGPRERRPVRLFEVVGTFEAEGIVDALDFLARHFAAETDGDRYPDGRQSDISIRPANHPNEGG
jgi:hypothetical protein